MRQGNPCALTAKTLLALPGEDPEAIQAKAQRFCDDLQPEGHDEEVLVDHIALASLRFDRAKELRIREPGVTDNTLDLPLSTLAIAIAVSGVVGYFVIAFFLRYLQTRTLKVFIVYRLVLGIIVLLLAFLQASPR